MPMVIPLVHRECWGRPRLSARDLRGDLRAERAPPAPARRATCRIGPGDDPFLTQSLQVHFVELFPGGENRGHGHQNEACFYILEGEGYEIHDGVRYEWQKDDFAIVH